MKKIVIVVCAVFATVAAYAGPHGCPGWGGHHHHCGGGPDRGLANAACIVDIVANGVGMLATVNAMNQQQVVYAQPQQVVYQQPVQQVVAQPQQVVQQVQYVQPATQVVVPTQTYNPRTQVIDNGRVRPRFLPLRIIDNLLFP